MTPVLGPVEARLVTTIRGKDTFYRAQFPRLRARRGPKKA